MESQAGPERQDDGRGDAGGFGEIGPGGHGLFDLIEYGSDLARLERGGQTSRMEICRGKSIAFAGQTHLMAVGPEVVHIGQIEGWRQTPHAMPVHQKSDIFGMIVLIPGHQIEDATAEEFGHVRMRQAELPGHLKGVLVGADSGILEIEVGQGA